MGLDVLHVAHSLHPSAGGPPIVAVNLAAAQARLGHTATVLGYHPPADRERSLAMIRNVPFEVPLQHHLLPKLGPLRGLIAADLRQALRQRLKHADILIAHGVWDTSIFHAARLAHRMGVPYVIRPAGMLDPWSLQQKSLKKKIAIQLLYRDILRHAAFIHTTSQDEANNVERLMERLRLTVPVHIIPNGIFLRDIELLPEKGAFFARYPALRDRPFIAFFGRLHHKKRPDLLMHAFSSIASQFPDVQLVVAGPDAGEGANLLQLAARLNIADRVHFPGPVYGRDKYALLVDAACFCLPSEQENFGVAVAEAMAAATPVIVSDQVQIGSQIREAGAGFICERNAPSIAHSLTALLSDDCLRLNMGLAGRELIQKVFLWRHIAQKSIDCYTAALSPTPATQTSPTPTLENRTSPPSPKTTTANP